jgi:hypothetical protein
MIAHFLYLYPLLKNKSIEEMIELFSQFGITMSEHDAKYIYYNVHAWDEQRNYPILREYLREMVNMHADLIELMIRRLFPYQTKDIVQVFDIGAGHDGYADILHRVFSNAEIVLIDKYPIKTKYTFIEANAFDCLPTLYGNKTLIWMSEFLHCKKENEEIMRTSLIENSHVLINEVYDKFVEHRLFQTGGNSFVFPKEYSCLEYDMHFKYVMGYKEPK